MDIASDKVLPYLTQVEQVAEEIIADKHQMVDLDRRRQKTREAIRVLQKDKTTEKNWVCFGNQFIKLPKKATKKLLDQDFEELDNQINDLRRELKPKVSKLRDMEKKEDIKGFNLNPLSKEEMRAVEELI
uniref:p53 and DNA damage regulated protein n=1 Tax=Mytilus galloprovincialis TaxID=29158 RepID=R4JNC5_MYTGA|nr:p53 and DNA damage regulated protein [Mytilus galloprovincialis]